MDDKVDKELADLPPDRRAFVKRVVAVSAFAVPAVASFDLADVSSAAAFPSSVSNTSNTTTFTIKPPG